MYSLEVACRQVESPLTRLEHALHPWVAYAVMPIFALANAGVALPADVGSALGDRITLGVILGLVLGKQAGVTLSCWLAERGLVTEESGEHQYRFVAIVDPDTRAPLFEIEHEVRSFTHPMAFRPLVNRNPAQRQRTYARGRDAFTPDAG